MEKRKMIEIVCQSPQDVRNACQFEIDRIELSASLHDGGLTPTLGLYKTCQKLANVPIVCIIRHRTGGYVYDDLDFEVMKEDAKQLLEAGADGIVFGFLKEDWTIDETKTRAMTELAHAYHKEAVFHRAFDCVKDFKQGLETLIQLGVDRVLTSGGLPKAADAIDILNELSQSSAIQILAGGGVTAENANLIFEKTNVTQIHSSCKYYVPDKGAHPLASQAINASGKQGYYEAVNPELVKQLVKAIKE